MTNSLAIFLLMVVIVTGSGCATYHVSLIGTNEVDVIPRKASWATNGSIVVELQVVRRDVGLPFIVHQNLGQRYAVFDDKAAGRIGMRSRMTNYMWNNLRGQTQLGIFMGGFILASNSTDLCRTPEWYLYPPDLNTTIKHASPPQGICVDPHSTVSFDKENTCFWIARLTNDVNIAAWPDRFSEYERNWVHGYNYKLTGKEGHAWWGFVRYPLYIPAIVIDVVTGPFEFMWLLSP